MLGRLIQNYAKAGPGLESTTEEAHSRSLLWPPHSHEGRGLLYSPPSTPIGSPPFRIGPFDDRGGLELNDSKNIRIIIAQDAFGSMDRPMVLFDTQPRASGGNGLSNSRKDLPLAQSSQQRNRSTTISGPSTAWSRPSRDPENNDKVHRLLDCMFGVTSATKSESSTKMHVLSSASDQTPIASQQSPSIYPNSATRTPLIRSRTSIQVPPAQKQMQPVKDEQSAAEDVVLVTRMFTVTLPESKEQVPVAAEDNILSKEPSHQSSTLRSDSFGTGKKPKLVEKKIPMYAVGLLLTIPPEDMRAALSRPPSRTSITSSSFPNSFGSDIASSWTLLDSIPDSLGSSAHSHKHADRRLEAVTSIWDVILRSLTWLEQIARADIRALLQQVDREIMASMVKTPKGPQEQRTNQRNIYIRNHLALSQARVLQQSCKQVVQRVSSALRIPRVVTGTGFLDGHWLDEARYLVQICGSKPQNFFFFNLLTAFLGNHTEWLEKIGAADHKQTLRRSQRKISQTGCLTARTVIVAERRSISRRLIFVLASFLLTPSGLNALEKDVAPVKSPLPTPGWPSSSPLKHSFKASEVAQEQQKHLRSQHVSFGTTDAIALSTSVSSSESVDDRSASRRQRHKMARNESDTASIRTASIFPTSGSTSLHLRKASAANSATTPHLTNPIAHFAAKGDSYFPEDAIVDGTESIASADLARILRRDSSSVAASGLQSPKWPALLSGLWAKKQDAADASPGGETSDRASSEVYRRGSTVSTSQSLKLSGSKLEDMVSEAQGLDVPRTRNAPLRGEHSDVAFESESVGRSLEPPRLRVDEDDGVIDVDVGITGFMSWEGDRGPVSPPRDHYASRSVQSLDGAASLRSSTSHPTGHTTIRGGEGQNVAGFLKRYHEDFVLQAVKPYEELQEEVKQSMLREGKLLNEASDFPKNFESTGEEEWFDVCSTLIADLRKFSIEHIILRRKRMHPSRPESAPKQSGPSDTRQRESLVTEQYFVIEPVVNFDMTLTDAIESVLDTANRRGLGSSAMKASHQRTISTSSDASIAVSTPPSSFSREHWGSRQKPLHLRSNCRQIVAEALEEVVKSVKHDLHQHDSGQAVGGEASGNRAEVEENVLREGVRKWLLNEETRAVW